MDYKLPFREENSNKGTFGKVLNISGSRYMRGCAYLSSVSALKIGAGYVVLCADEKVLDNLNAPEVVLAPLKKLEKLINECDVISIGCGLSTDENAVKSFKKFVKLRNFKPSVIDADGINILAKNFVKLDKNTILTPHPKEASRLLGCSVEEISEDIEKSAKMICEKYGCITVLKVHNTIVCDGDNIYRNETGSSALAKAGSGDVLTGIIAGLLAQKMKPFEAASLGVYLHGLAGDIASGELSKYCVLASDLIKYLPYAVKNYLSEEINN